MSRTLPCSYCGDNMWDHLSACYNCKPVNVTHIKELLDRLEKRIAEITTISPKELNKPQGLEGLELLLTYKKEDIS